MSSRQYSAAERGGGSGDTGRMRAAILNQINSWWGQAKWQDQEKADRIHEKLNEAPERFISPNPDANYREEASRIYGELKEEYSLRGVNDLEEAAREYEAKAEAYHEKRGQELETNEIGGAPEPREIGSSDPVQYPEGSEPEPDPDPEPVEIPDPEPVDEITPETDQADIEITADPDPEPEPVETSEIETPETRDYSGIIGFGRLLVDSILANYEQGKQESLSKDASNQQTLEAY